MKEEDYLAQAKAGFQEEYGTENQFKTTYEDESVKEEVNGSTGDIRITNKGTGEVETGNYYETAKEEYNLNNLF